MYVIKTIVITGASSGIGKALSEHLASMNHNVIAVARSEDKLNSLKNLYPMKITTVVADISKTEELQKIKTAVGNDTGVYLVHSAGIALPRLIAELTEDEWEMHYLINVKAPLFLTRLLLPNLENGGRVLHISTGLSHKALTGMSAYGTSKAAFFLLKEYFNVEMKEKNILFGSAMPGTVDTPIQEKLRSYSAERFPAVGLFKDFYSQNKLLNPKVVANFLAWLLLSVDNEEYVKGEWDIYDSSHHSNWEEKEEMNIYRV